jgi:hypothetical protein
VALCAPRLEKAAQDLLGRAVSRYMKKAGQLAAGGHGLPTAVMNKIMHYGHLRIQSHDHCRCVSYLERFHSSNRISLYLLSRWKDEQQCFVFEYRQRTFTGSCKCKLLELSRS